jgi:formiminotetrahydrofolate cyclodeaminase
VTEPEASGKHGEPRYLDLSLRTFLGLLAGASPAPAGGAAAALGVALAASLCAMTARVSRRQLPEAAELAAEAERLADLVAPLAQADAEAYGAVLAARPPGQADLAAALSDAADVPMQIAEIGARIAALATRLAAHGHPNLHGDAVVAALLAGAGTRSACALVRINLAGAGSDERLARVTHLLAALPPAPSG